MKTKTFKARIADACGVAADKIVAHKDGTVSVKRSFFYTHGMTSYLWAEQVLNCANSDEKISDFAFVYKTQDVYRSWPKTSYFVVTLKSKESLNS